MQNLEFRRVLNFLNLNESVFKRREKHIALDLAFDQREVKIGTARQHLLVNLRAAADENFIGEFRAMLPLKHLVQSMKVESSGIRFPMHSGRFLTIPILLRPALLVTEKLKQARLPRRGILTNFLIRPVTELFSLFCT